LENCVLFRKEKKKLMDSTIVVRVNTVRLGLTFKQSQLARK